VAGNPLREKKRERIWPLLLWIFFPNGDNAKATILCLTCGEENGLPLLPEPSEAKFGVANPGLQ
jgi:hypothetical protein